MIDAGSNITIYHSAESFKWQTLLEWYEDGAARYMAHARKQMADGLLEHAGCSLRKAAHKARQAKAVRNLLSFSDGRAGY